MSVLRRTLVAATAAAALAAPFASFAQDIKPRLIRFGYGLNEDSNQGRAVKLFAQEVAARCASAPSAPPRSARTCRCSRR